MQVYVQKSTRTTLPRRPAGVSGGELSHPVAPPNPGRSPSSDNGAGPPWRRTPRKLISHLRSRGPRGRRRRSSHRPERRANLGGEQIRLLPGGEVVPPIDLVEVDEVRVGLLGPAPRRLIELPRKDAHGGRDGDALHVEEPQRVLPVETTRGHPGVREPRERDVVEDLVPCQVADGAARA